MIEKNCGPYFEWDWPNLWYTLLDDKKRVKVKVNWFAIQCCQNVPDIKIVNQHGGHIAIRTRHKSFYRLPLYLLKAWAYLFYHWSVLLTWGMFYFYLFLYLFYALPTSQIQAQILFIFFMVTSLFSNYSRPATGISLFFY